MPLDAALDQVQIGMVTEAEAVEPLGFSTADVAWGGTACGVGVFVEVDQGLPVLVTGALHRFADALSGERHVRSPGVVPTA
jgi:hypothetical protein